MKIAWRNIWRNPTRSFVVIGAIVVGVWAIIFLISFSAGSISSYVDNAIKNEISHIQIHHPDFPKNRDIKFSLPAPDSIISSIKSTPGVKAVTARTLAFGMLSSSKGARGIRIQGVDPQSEKMVTHLEKKIIEGSYFEEDKRHPILLSENLADKLNVKLRSKLVLTFQDLHGEITAGAFRVSGIYDTGNNVFDESHVFIRRYDLNRLLGDSSLSHEIAVYLEPTFSADSAAARWKPKYPALQVQSYKEISPEIELFESQIQLSSTIFTIIVMLGLIFGIINTMLMAVLERYHELGMLMSIGMNKIRLFLMVMSETILLSLVGAPVGLSLGYLTVQWLHRTGIDLSLYSEGMQEFGLSQIVYPELHSQYYWQVAFAVMVTAFLGSLYPAWKAIRLKPVEAIRKI